MNNKIGGKSFKFSSTPFEYKKPPKVLPHNKKDCEFLLSIIFSHFLIFNKIRISKIEVNEDDSNGKPDIKMIISGKEKGVQLTKFSLNEPLRRINTAERIIDELIDLILQIKKIPKLINISIYPPKTENNFLPSGNLKIKKKLAKFIADSIEKNTDKIYGNKSETVFLKIDQQELLKIVSNITLNPIPKNHKSLFRGKENIFINYEFDTHQFDEEDLQNEIKRIIKTKERGKSEILLIWGERFELLYQDEKIVPKLIEKFKNSSFENIFFLTLFDRQDIFLNSWKIYKIK